MAGMRASPDDFRAYLAPDETVVEWVSGTLVDGSDRPEGTIGITDRRVVFVAEGDRFLDVAHGAISSMRSRPRRPFTARGTGYRLAALVGVLVGLAGIAGPVLLLPTPGVFALALVAVGGAVAGEYARRTGDAVGPGALAAVRGRRGEQSDENADGGDRPGRLRGVVVDANEVAGPDALVFGLGVASVFALIGLVVRTGGLLVVPLVLVSLAGVAWADIARRRTKALDRVGGSRRHERDVTIHLVDGRVVDLRVDSTDRIDRELSGVVRGGAPRTGATAVDGSPAEAGRSPRRT